MSSIAASPVSCRHCHNCVTWEAHKKCLMRSCIQATLLQSALSYCVADFTFCCAIIQVIIRGKGSSTTKQVEPLQVRALCLSNITCNKQQHIMSAACNRKEQTTSALPAGTSILRSWHQVSVHQIRAQLLLLSHPSINYLRIQASTYRSAHDASSTT